MTEIEDQALMVYYLWLCKMSSREGYYDEEFERHLAGLFELLKRHFPNEASEAFGDFRVRTAADKGSDS